GLHTGECEVLDGKVGGIAVHIGARVAKEAQPGEVLVSSTVKDLVAGSGLRFRESGTAELKGVPEQWRLYAVESAGYRALRRQSGGGCSIEVPAAGDALELVLTRVVEREAASGDEVLHGPGDHDLSRAGGA